MKTLAPIIHHKNVMKHDSSTNIIQEQFVFIIYDLLINGSLQSKSLDITVSILEIGYHNNEF